MRFVRYCCLALLLSSCLAPTHALWKDKANKDKKRQAFYQQLQDRTQIQRDFRSSKNSYKAHLDIAVVLDKGDIVVKHDYDELRDLAIKNLEWLYDDQSTRPYRSQNIINKELERQSDADNPIQAYDRILNSKHMRSKLFYFKLDKVFEKVKKADERKAQQIKIYWINKAVITVPLSDIYKPITQPEPQQAQKKKEKKKKSKPKKQKTKKLSAKEQKLQHLTELEEQFQRQQEEMQRDIIKTQQALQGLQSNPGAVPGLGADTYMPSFDQVTPHINIQDQF